ncbi:hypothetical protein ACFWMQ_25275 [Streptomyces sp. NPDC058372]|uniref:hypothetical protein n=1 Tax=Streptomyces sp. NPDC058372 TaxID=3346464 RepID=UPI00366110CC
MSLVVWHPRTRRQLVLLDVEGALRRVAAVPLGDKQFLLPERELQTYPGASDPRAVAGCVARLVTPETVREGDLVSVAGDYRRVLARGHTKAGGRRLLLEAYGPWVMAFDRVAFRRPASPQPWNRPSAGTADSPCVPPYAHCVVCEGEALSAWVRHLEWKREQILAQHREGMPLTRLCEVYEVPPDVLRACLARWEPEAG